jgi:hypothetical protein
MGRRASLIICAFALGLSFAGASAQTTIYGGRGLLRVFSAEPLAGSQLHVNSYFQTFLANDNPLSASLAKDYTFSIGLTYAVSRRTEITAQLVPYQDDQKHIWGPPGDTQLGIKYQTPLSSNNVLTGVRAFLIFPTARLHNVPYEPYSSGKLALGAQALLTLDMTESFPLVPLKFYANIGYIDHYVRDLLLRNDQDQALLGFGVKFPIHTVVLFTEYTAEIFIHYDALSYSQNPSRLTQGISLLGPWNLVLDFAIDIDLSSTKERTGIFYGKDYADWKISLGAHYQFAFGKKSRPGVEPARQSSSPSNRKELDEIKARRQRARLDIERMNDALNEEPEKEKAESADKQPPR